VGKDSGNRSDQAKVGSSNQSRSRIMNLVSASFHRCDTWWIPGKKTCFFPDWQYHKRGSL